MPVRKLNKKAVALGNFDGLHTGHQRVLSEALSFQKKCLEPTVVLFDIHPKEYITGDKIEYLLLKTETENLLRDMGFSVITIPFSRVQGLSPEAFLKNVLIEELNAQAVCCGFNYSFGKNGEGDSEALKHLCENQGIECRVCDEMQLDGITVSSSVIREFLKNGEIETANKMLSRNYFFESEVVHGDSRGHTLGFPTVNQKIPEGLVVPKFGVYETLVTVDGKKYRSVTNIGVRPTYLSDTVLSETNILDFSGDAYGKSVKVELVRYLRSEQKFNSLQELINQLNADKKRVLDSV